jgi:hypothetical protein
MYAFDCFFGIFLTLSACFCSRFLCSLQKLQTNDVIPCGCHPQNNRKLMALSCGYFKRWVQYEDFKPSFNIKKI